MFVIAASALPATSGEPYEPVPLASANLIIPPPDLVQAASALLDAVQRGDQEAIAAGLAPRLTLIDGALELGLLRRTEQIGPFDTVGLALAALADNIGGIYEQPFDGRDVTPYAAKAERDFIIRALTDGQRWGRDPMLEDAICTYGYRSFDRSAVTALGERLDTQTSSFFFVESPIAVLTLPGQGASVAATLEPNLLYGLDYDTEAPGRWIAIHLPEGGSGYLNFEMTEFSKPYASGICFSKDANGRWRMSAQTATNQ
ncbi:MAG: hypothetical protein KKF33_07145 [Alphaproteobacteria bacterium]|nr:hypothetical protein [Alphaproteobacteria bacterium]